MRVPASTALRMPNDTSTKSRKVLKWCLACLDKFVNPSDSPCLPLATWLNSPRSAGLAMWSAVGRARAWIVRYGGDVGPKTRQLVTRPAPFLTLVPKRDNS